jgi:hypothetical protein
MKMAAKKPMARKMSKPKVEVVKIDMEEDKKYRAMSDMDTVMRAQEIMSDRSRMSMVKKLAAKQAIMAERIAKK